MKAIMDRRFEVTILGSGTCVPSLKRSSCSVLLAFGDDKLLLDAGSGTIRRLLEANTTIYEITHIFFSHFHPDHTGELAPFLFSTKYSFLHQRKKPLTIIAGMGFKMFFDKLNAVYGKWIQLEPDMISVYELSNRNLDHFRGNGFAVDSLPMNHNEESIAYRIYGDRNNRSVIYSGDTDTCENLVTLAKNGDLLICESSFPDDMKKSGHLTPSEAGELAARANVKQLVLTHFYPECDGVNIEMECRKTYNGPLILAEDLMKLVV